MPEATLTLQNDTSSSLVYAETSPEDPQVVTVKPGIPESLRIKYEPARGGVHVIVCNGYISDGTENCSPGANNVVGFTVYPDYAIDFDYESQNGDSFTAKVTNKTLASMYCVLAGPGSQHAHGPVLATGSPMSLSIPTTGAVKWLFCKSFFGESTFPFEDPVEKITVIAKIENGSPTVRYEGTAP